ncbi:hypothetical protein CAEBREN_24250 [Caenorhabditis brenneri]|uniref:BRK domain-containing protein n=1 Tax=Caenorhabditis brenneri TaxID=135651 RepID=G0NFN1_CAEBE|nr:hypothetical protein CAEBREN_24250 [Caenorhabditis brenneri]
MELIQSLIKPVDSYIKQTGAQKGFRKTQRPHLPRILNSETGWHTINSMKDHPVIGVTLGPWGKVEPRCVQLIRDVIGHIFRAQPKTLKMIYSHIPLNAICVSVACTNFYVGTHCHQFYQPEESSENHFSWSYQMHSANVQTCHYTEANVEYLAGIIYYPVEKGRAKCIKNDSGLIQHLWLSREFYPMCDRTETELFKASRKYGRYCSQAGRRVLVDARHSITQHVEYDYKNHASISVFCAECELDDANYMMKRTMGIHTAIENLNRNPPPAPPAPHSDPLQKLQDLITLYGQEPSILVFNRATGKLLEESRWPKMRDLEYFLVENQECNVHINSALQAHLVLRDGMKDRIGEGPGAVEEVGDDREREEEDPEDDPEEEVEDEEQDETVENLITIYSPRGEPNDEKLWDNDFSDVGLSSTKMRELGLSDLDLDVFETYLPTDTMTPSTSSPEEPGPSKRHVPYRHDMEYIDNC